MKNLIFTFIFALAFVFISCSSSNTAFHNTNSENWEVNVKHKSGILESFQVTINDSMVIDESTNFLTGNLDAKGKYRNKNVKLNVIYSTGFLGMSSEYHATVFIDNQLVAKFKF